MPGYGGQLWAVRLLPFAAAARVTDVTPLPSQLCGLILKCQSPEPCPNGRPIPEYQAPTVARFTVKKILTLASGKRLALKRQ
jgi:hypothetical protein